MFCPNCGKSNPDDSKFCESCGANMLDPASSPAQTASSAPPPPPPPPPAYQPAPAPQPAYQPVQGNVIDLNKPVGVGGYLGMFAINLIPVVGGLIFFIMLFVWSFGSEVNTNKKNLARALLLLALIIFVLGIIVGVVFGGILAPLIEDIMDQMY